MVGCWEGVGFQPATHALQERMYLLHIHVLQVVQQWAGQWEALLGLDLHQAGAVSYGLDQHVTEVADGVHSVEVHRAGGCWVEVDSLVVGLVYMAHCLQQLHMQYLVGCYLVGRCLVERSLVGRNKVGRSLLERSQVGCSLLEQRRSSARQI